MRKLNTKQRQLGLAITAASFAMCAGNVANAQAQDSQSSQDSTYTPPVVAPVIEEMIVSGRLISGQKSLVEERLDEAFAADLLGSEQISRVGDSDVAAALMRVTGVTVREGEYVYVRGLGERYSSVRLNGAAVPSPELTRNVLPLDVIPTSMVETLKVQKSYSPDLPAHFGGGAVDIRTKSLPDEFIFEVEVGTSTNSESSDDGLTYASGGEMNALPSAIGNALNTYQGKINNNGIIDIIDTDGGSPSAEQVTQARQINRQLMTNLNPDIEIKRESIPLDFDGAVVLGNSWDLSDDWSLGALVNASFDRETRNKNQSKYGVGSPENNYFNIERTTEKTQELYSVNLGLNYQDMHDLEFNIYQIQITEDDAQIETGHDANNRPESGQQVVSYSTRYQERELEVYQVVGEHQFDQLSGEVFGDIDVNWYYSDSAVETNIPGMSTVKGTNRINPETGEVISTQLLSTSAVANFAFLNLQDDVESYGVDVDIPLFFDNTEVTLSGGYSYNDKTREYYGYTANIDAIGVLSSVLSGTPGQVLTDAALTDLNNPFELTMGGGLGTESYIAAQMTDAAYGMVDVTWDETWRLTAGARYESFRQAVLPLNLLDYSGEYLGSLIDQLGSENQRFAIEDDGWYPSVALTYMNNGFMGTQDFQIRASFAQTVVRPDLREVSEVVYIDPELAIQVEGNPLLKTSELDHFDLRGEWVYDNGDNFTLSLFYKDVADPIEQSRKPGSDENIMLTFYNGEEGEIYGVEFEGLKNLGAGFFVSGNLTLSDSEIVSPDNEGYTSLKRRMNGQSEYVLNTQLGYDSDNGMHSASLVYNVFGDRVYYAARSNGHDDAFEQPFHSLDIVYSFFPADAITAKLKVGNILDEKRTFEQTNSRGNNVTILEQEVGTTFSVNLRYSF